MWPLRSKEATISERELTALRAGLGIVQQHQEVLAHIETLAKVCKDLAEVLQRQGNTIEELNTHVQGLQARLAELEE